MKELREKVWLLKFDVPMTIGTDELGLQSWWLSFVDFYEARHLNV